MSHRFTGNAAIPATINETGRVIQKRALARPAFMAPGIEKVSEAKASGCDGEGKARRKQGPDGETVPKEERQHYRDGYHGRVVPPEGGADDHPGHLTDRASRETMNGGAERDALRRGGQFSPNAATHSGVLNQGLPTCGWSPLTTALWSSHAALATTPNTFSFGAWADSPVRPA